jgi:hypothetical protein
VLDEAIRISYIILPIQLPISVVIFELVNYPCKKRDKCHLLSKISTTMKQNSSLLFSLLPWLCAANNHHTSSSSDHHMACGNLTCHNGGQCVDISFLAEEQEVPEDPKVLEANAEASGTLLTFCQCPVGYSGITCEVHHDNICEPTQTVCKSGRECVTNSQDPLVGECPCDIAYGVSIFAGMMCEKPATEYCDQYNHETGHELFCTNGGTCRNTLVANGETVDQDSWGNVEGDRSTTCICPPEFEGEHCEALNGYRASAMEGYPAMSAKERREARFGVAVFVLAILSGVAFLLGLGVKRYLIGSHQNPSEGDDEVPNDLELEIEQGVKEIDTDLKNDIGSGNRSPTSVNTFDIDQIVDVQDSHDEAKFV